MKKILIHLFLPHPSNNHKAKILHPKGLTILIALVIAFQLTLGFASKLRPDVLGFAVDISVDKLLEFTNKERLETGISQLELNNSLSLAANEKAKDMFAKDYWAHVSPGGTTPWDFILAAGYKYVYAGENLAKDFQDAKGVVSAWMDSPSHKENILQSKYRDVGFAVVNGRLNGEDTTLVVQMFGTQEPTGAVSKEKISAPPKNNVKSAKEGVQGVVKTKPLIDLNLVSRIIMGGVGFILILILIIDAIVISRKKIVRISGDNAAHILLLTGFLIALILLGRGTII